MGIINRMWQQVWDSEQSKKSLKATIAAERTYKEIMEELTEAQKACMAMGGPERVYAQNSLHLHQMQNNNSLHLHQMQSNMVNQAQHPGWSSVGNAVGGVGTAGGGLMPGAIIATGGSGPAHTHTIGGPGQGLYPQPAYPQPILGTGDRDNFFIALKGIEEAAMQKPDVNHKYDDLAYAIFDMRSFDPKRISLLSLCSFCLANGMEVMPLVLLLEGYGMTVVDE